MSSPATPITPAELLETLAGGATILLPTAAAARALRHTYDLTQRNRNLTAWEPAPILSWSQFLDHLWSEAIVNGLETRLLLNPAQEHLLWVEVIASAANQQPESTLASTDSLADLARNAWTLAHAYNATNRLRAFATTSDARTFATWAEAFQTLCDRNAYLSRAALESVLQTHLKAHTLTTPPTLILAGFPNLTPSHQTLLDTLRTVGSQITEHPLTTTNLGAPAPDFRTWEFAATIPGSRAILPATETEEFRIIAGWLQNFIQNFKLSAHSPRIAVLLSDIAQAPILESTLREILTPELQPIQIDLSSTPWEFSNQSPLAAIPLIATALDLAHFAQSSLPLTKVSSLLLSPYLTTPADRDLHAQFDAQVLRRASFLRPELTLPQLFHIVQSSSQSIVWLQPLIQNITKSGNWTAPRTFADWSEIIRSLVASTNWPGDPASLTSLEFHATQAWDSLLDQLATLDFRGRRVPYATALQTLDRLASTTPFTPPSTNAPIQIMPPFAAVGQTFDAIVLLGATDTAYPPAEHPNPLLGWGLQSSLDMPGISQTRAAERTQQALNQLLASAPNILISYPTETSDGPQRLAPILAALNWPTVTPISTPTPAPILAEEIHEDTTPIPALQSPHVRGGARVLQLQAACGFRAFAEVRLNAQTLESADLGFDAPESGRHLHKALQHFWRKVESQQNLRSMSRQTRDEILNHSIDQALAEYPQGQVDWDEAYLSLQKQRLNLILQQWLDKELERSPFFVLEREHEEDIAIGPLTLEVRYDRIDKLPGPTANDPPEGFVLVDYKTGASGKPSDWETNRPDDPQLPLYALPWDPGELKALTFARIRAGEMKWLGVQDRPGILPASRANEVRDLAAQIDDWRSTLLQLANDFASGKATVDPREYPKTCRLCAQRLLCRIDPAALPNASSDDEEPLND